MVRIFFLAIFLILGSYNTAQVEIPGYLRIGLRLLSGNQFPKDNQAQQLLREAEQEIVENSVHYEKILKTPATFLATSLKRIVARTNSKVEIGSPDKHHKKTNLIKVAENLNLTTFLQKAKEAGIDDVLDHEGQFTVFAPTNEAFERTPKFCANVKVKDLMKFHVSRGRVPSSDFKNNLILRSLLTRRGIRINVYENETVSTANGRRLNQTDFKASNGILHVIDDVMCAVYRGSAVFAINRCPNLTMLANAINTTGLYTTLDRTKRLTLFAPTDAAFAKIPPETLDALLNNVTALKDVLMYHVVPDVWYSPGLEDGLNLTTLQGQNISIGVSDNVTVNDATVVAPDATVRNGVVHGIDTVLLPNNGSENVPWLNLQPAVFII